LFIPSILYDNGTNSPWDEQSPKPIDPYILLANMRWSTVRSILPGRRLSGDWGRSPKLWGGGRPMHPSPQYFEKYCYWMWGKVRTGKLSKKGVKEEIFVLKYRFWSGKGLYRPTCIFN